MRPDWRRASARKVSSVIFSRLKFDSYEVVVFHVLTGAAPITFETKPVIRKFNAN